MKKISLILITMFILVLFGCSNAANSGSDGNSNTVPSGTTFTAGWYKYTVSVQGTTQNYYLKYDTNKNLERAGSDTAEFTGTVFDNYKNNDGFSFDNLSKATNEASFRKITDSELPSWATSSGNTNNEETYLSSLCNFLQNYSSGTNNFGDTITLSNINTNIQKDSNNAPYITCNISATCNNQNSKALYYTNNNSVSYISVRLYYRYSITGSSTAYYMDLTNSKNKNDVSNNYPFYYLEYEASNNSRLGIYKQDNASHATGLIYTK